MPATTSDHALRIAADAAELLLIASVLCLCLCFMLRVFRHFHEARVARLEAIWRNVCFAATLHEFPRALPIPSERDLAPVIVIMLDTLERTRGQQASDGLRQLAQHLRFGERLRPWLVSRSTDRKLLALLMFAVLRDPVATGTARRYLDDPYPLLSMAAMRALMEINPMLAVPELLKRVDKPGWSRGQLSRLLQRAPVEALWPAFEAALRAAPLRQLPALLQIIHVLALSDFEPAARIAMARFPETDRHGIQATVLSLTADPAHLGMARDYLHAEDSALRHAAIQSLGSLGDSTDLPALLQRLETDDVVGRRLAAASLARLIAEPEEARQVANALASDVAKLHWLEVMSARGWLLTMGEVT